MIRGTLYAVSDINIALQSMQSCKVLYIGELNNSIPKEFIECSVLLPPYEAVFAEVDGDIASFEAIYNHYLTYSDQCFGMFATILVALNRGVNILMYIENGDDFAHFNFLLRYIQGTFGITVGSENMNFQYNPEYNWLISSILYSYMDGFIDEYEFIMNQNNFNLVLALDQNHPFTKPITKLANKFGNMVYNDPITWMVNYKKFVSSYGNITPGTMVTFRKDE
jgi:hypothetical protein